MELMVQLDKDLPLIKGYPIKYNNDICGIVKEYNNITGFTIITVTDIDLLENKLYNDNNIISISSRKLLE